MANSKKQYVFDILVKDKSDVLQLLTYAMYCRSKNERANQLHDEGKEQSEIEDELKRYHQLIATSENLQKFLHSEAQKAHAVYTSKIEKQTIKEFINKIQISPNNKQTRLQWVGGKVIDAIAGIAATIIVIVICVGLASLRADKEDRDAMFEAGAQEAKGIMNGEIPVVDKYRAIKKENKEKKLAAERAKAAESK